MSDVVFARLAVVDLGDIWDYTFDTWGLTQAERYIDDIEMTCVDLAAGLRVGRRETARDGYFRYSVGQHVVFCKVTQSGIIVMRVLHQRMDVGRRLEEND